MKKRFKLLTVAICIALAATMLGVFAGCNGDNEDLGALTFSGAVLPMGFEGIAYSHVLPVATAPEGQTPAITYTLATGSTLPAGLNFNAATRAITGTPTAVVAAHSFSVVASAPNFTPATAIFTITISSAGEIAFSTHNIPNATINVAFEYQIGPAIAPGATATHTLTGGNLPAGLSINEAGLITGTPTATGDFDFEITANADGFDPVVVEFQITVTLTAFHFPVVLTDLTGFNGGSMEYGGDHPSFTTVERTGLGNGPFDTVGQLFPYFLQGVHNAMGTVVWTIYSNVASVAELHMSLGMEIPTSITMHSLSGGGGHRINHNGVDLAFSDITLSRENMASPIQFNLHYIATINLVAGNNTITFHFGSNTWLMAYPNADGTDGGPSLDTLVLYTDAVLSWGNPPQVGNIYNRFQGSPLSDLQHNPQTTRF